MHNVLLIIRREYLQLVRTRSFLLTTLIMPVLMFGSIALPTRLVMSKNKSTSHIAAVVSSPQFGQAIKDELNTETLAGRDYNVEVVTDTADVERETLRSKVVAGELDGYLWATDDALSEQKVTFATRDTSDFMESAGLRAAVSMALLKYRLAERGVAIPEVDSMLKTLKLETVKVQAHGESRSAGRMEFLGSFGMALLLYVALVLYGVSVMRSVLEEKSSRVVEVMLSSVSSTELMAGKILGVGAVGLTQILIWIATAVIVAVPGLVTTAGSSNWLQFSPMALGGFAVLFLLGYLLYSTMYAALGTLLGSEHEAQQWQFIVSLPIIIPVILMPYALRQPNAPATVWLSLVPFFAPILMYVRLVGQTPPLWQLLACLVLLLATIYALLIICSRIYRTGILMYGKRPTLPEIIKWVRYA